MTHYDYIISGAGAAGLSLLMRFMQHEHFATKKILLVDKEPKIKNDHTWCFWEKHAGLFEPVVYSKWQQVHFFSNYYSSKLDLAPYYYKMVRSIDFYKYVFEEAQKRDNISIIYANVEAVGNEGNNGLVIADGVKYTAEYVFNSIIFSKPHVPAGKYYLLQHFKGLLIEATGPVFDPASATLMDFRVSQQHGTTFVYVLPITENKALVEYTLFSKQLLKESEYDEALKNYISSFLNIKEYTVVEEEFGIIPMTNISYVKQVNKVINLGTAGGQTKASSGYTFQFIQKHTAGLVASILKNGFPKNEDGFMEKRFKIYDSTLLNVLSNNKIGGDKVFSDLFEKNPVDRVLRFLDNESSLEDEINLMATVPQGIFIKAAFQELFK